MDQNAKRTLLRKIPYGMYVVTTQDGDRRNGLTVTWLSQVSFRPPLVAMAVAKACRNYPMIRRAGVVAIHFLPKSGAKTANLFILPTRRKPDKFEGLAVAQGVTGAPVIDDVMGVLEGRLVHTLETIGDHDVLVFEIVEARLGRDEPLLYLSDTTLQYAG